MAREETILEVQEQINLIDTGIEGVYMLPIEGMVGSIVEGEKYEVVWGEDTYLVTAVTREWTDPDTSETMLFPTLGNAALLTYMNGTTYEETDEPFLIYQIEGATAIISSDATISGLGIYTYSEPDGIVLKDPLGRSITYGEYSKIKLTRASGIQSIFSEGEAETKEISTLDFKDVNEMVVVPDEKKLFSEVTIIKPATLLPENIAEGIEIAGITGTFVGSEDPVLNLEATELPFTLDEDFGKYTYTGEGITYIIPDANYTITYGETSYDIKSVWVESFNSAILGNTAFWGGEDTGEPFMIIVKDNKDMWIVDMYSQPESVNMAVSLVTETQTGGSSTLELEETTLEFTDVGYAYGYITDETFPDIRAGASYTVTWDGTEYACTALEVDGDVIMGNFIPLTGVDTGEPFIYLPNMATGEGTVLYSVYDTAQATHTVSIKLNFVSSDPVYTMDTTTLTFADAGGIYQCIQSLPLTHVLNGAHYVVTVDGTAYPTKGYVEEGGSLIGNMALMYGEGAEDVGIEDTGEPFAIILQTGIEGIITTLAGESHDISVALNFEGGNSGSGTVPLNVAEVYDAEVDDVPKYKFYYDTSLKKITLPNATKLSGDSAFYQCTSLEEVDMPKVTNISAYNVFDYCTNLKIVNMPNLTTTKSGFSNCTSLETVDFPLATQIPSFSSCSNLKNVNLPEATSCADASSFSRCTSLKRIVLPKVTALNAYTFQNDTALKFVDLPVCTQINPSSSYFYTFKSCSALKALILRSPTVCAMGNANNFDSSGIHYGTGYVYVPSALVDTYKTSWSTFASQIRALEDYTVDGTITGELDETKI